MINALFKPSSLFGILALIISSYLLFEIKYKVKEIRKEISQLDNEILKAKEDIHILKAEWSYVTKPETLGKMAQKKLSLVPIDPKKVKSSDIDELSNIFEKGGKEEK
jgi:cell division protein FtsL